MLREYGIPFAAHNDGAHLIIQYTEPEVVINFYPGTGLWRVQGARTEGRGVRNLINYISRFSPLESR